MEKYNIYPSTARALGNVMNSKGTQEEIDCVYCETTHPVLVNNMSVEYDGISWPIFKMEVDSSLYNITLNLSATKTEITINENVVLTAKALDNKSKPIKGLSIKFYDGSTLINTVTTNDDGVATVSLEYDYLTTATITAKFEGSNRYNAKTSNAVTLEVNSLLTSSVTDFVLKQNGNIVLSAPTSSYEGICPNLPLTLEWDVKVNNNTYTSAVCQVWDKGTLVDTLPAGQTTYTISPEGGGTEYGYYIQVVRSDTYNECSSDGIQFYEIPYIEPVINISLSKSEVLVGEPCTITGTVLDQNGNPLANVPVKLYSSEWNYNPLHTQYTTPTVIATETSNRSGEVTFNLLNEHAGSGEYLDTCGKWRYTLKVDSASCRASAESSNVTLTMERVLPTLNVSDLTCYEGYCRLSATLLNQEGAAMSGEDLYVRIFTGDGYGEYIDVHATTNTNGVATFDLASIPAGTYDAGVVFVTEESGFGAIDEDITITILEDKQLTITNFNVSTTDRTFDSPVCCINPNETITFAATVKLSHGNIVQGLQVNFLLDDTTLVSGLINSQGKVSVSETAPGSGSYTVKAVVPNSGKYIGCSKEDALIIIEDSTTRACEDYVS